MSDLFENINYIRNLRNELLLVWTNNLAFKFNYFSIIRIVALILN